MWCGESRSYPLDIGLAGRERNRGRLWEPNGTVPF
jgi:hypothetical protein